MNWTTAALHCTVLHSTILYCTILYYTVLYYTLIYIGVPHVTINISIRYSSEWVIFCCSYVFCHKWSLMERYQCLRYLQNRIEVYFKSLLQTPSTSKSVHYIRRYRQSKLDVKFVTHRHTERNGTDTLWYYIGLGSLHRDIQY